MLRTKLTKMPYLNYIKDSDLEDAVGFMLAAAESGQETAKKKFARNVIDPFAVVFEMVGFDIPTVAEWEKSEQARQAQKTLGQALGDFHQRVLGSIKGWENLGVGNNIDLFCPSKKIIAEVKNKHNTVTGGQLSALYHGLDDLVMPKSSKYHRHTAYYVEIIPKKGESYDVEFTPSDRTRSKKCPANPKIRKIDGKSFYALASGKDDALPKLYEALPNVIKTVCGKSYAAKELMLMENYFKAAFK